MWPKTAPSDDPPEPATTPTPHSPQNPSSTSRPLRPEPDNADQTDQGIHESCGPSLDPESPRRYAHHGSTAKTEADTPHHRRSPHSENPASPMNNAQMQPSPAVPALASGPAPEPADDAATNPASAAAAMQRPPSCRNPSEPDQARPDQPATTESSQPESESVRCSPTESMTAAKPYPNPASQTPEASGPKHPQLEAPPAH